MSARILVVDDVEANVRLLEAKLTLEYYDVLTCGDGASCLRLARDEQPDLILLDVMMPGMDGYAACRALKADPATADHLLGEAIFGRDRGNDRIIYRREVMP